MTTFTIGLGETIVIPARTVEEHLHDLRRTRGLPATNHLENGAKAKILRAYTRPRGQSCISIEVSETEVKVIAMVLQHKDKDGNVLDPPLDVTERGHAVVDIIDEISEPWGDDHDIYVVRQPQLKADVPAAPKAPVAVKAAAPAPLEVKADL
jgi:hypothetical protein